MFATKTLASLLDEQTVVLRTQLHAVYDGLADAIHDSRVATRRIRELLALVPAIPGRDGERDVASGYQKIGRALGKVRDIDVQIALIKDLEVHAPETAPSMVVVRQDHGTRDDHRHSERTDEPAVARSRTRLREGSSSVPIRLGLQL